MYLRLATFLFVLYEETSVCSRICVELACLLCKILIAHCIYEGSWKRRCQRPDEKCFSTYMKSPLPTAPHGVLMLCLRCSLCSCCEWITWYPVFPSLNPTCWPVWRVVSVKHQTTASQGWRFRMPKLLTWTVLHRFQGRGFYGDGYWVVMLTTVVAPTLPPPHPQRKMWYSFGEVCFCRIPGFWRKIISPVSIWPSLCWLRWIKALKTTLTVCRLLCYKWKIYLWQRFEVCTIGISRCFQLIYDTFQILFINKQLFVTNRTICRTAKPLHFICSVFTECRDYLLLLIS